MSRFKTTDVLAIVLFLVVLFTGTAAYVRSFFQRGGVDGVLRDLVDDAIHPAKSKPEQEP